MLGEINMFDNWTNISWAKEKRHNMLKTLCFLVERSSMEASSICGALSISGVPESYVLIFNKTNSYLLVASCCWSTTAYLCKMELSERERMWWRWTALWTWCMHSDRYRCSRQDFSFMPIRRHAAAGALVGSSPRARDRALKMKKVKVEMMRVVRKACQPLVWQQPGQLQPYHWMESWLLAF
jgi:hypothetical protein